MAKDDDKRLAAFKADSFGSDEPKNRVEHLTMTFLAIRTFDFSLFSHIYWNMLYKLKSLSITLYALLPTAISNIRRENIFRWCAEIVSSGWIFCVVSITCHELMCPRYDIWHSFPTLLLFFYHFSLGCQVIKTQQHCEICVISRKSQINML